MSWVSLRCRHVAHALTGFVLAFGASAAFGWGADGHHTIGKLAGTLIAGSRAEAMVQQIIGGISLEDASVWADCVKGVAPDASGKLAYQSTGRFKECLVFETSEEEARMVAYVSRNFDACHPQPGEETPCHKQYHYTDIAPQREHYQPGLVGTSDHDVVAAVNAALLVLKGGTAPPPFVFGQREALLVMIHIVEDMHQPLHVQSIYLDSQGKRLDPDVGAYDPASRTNGGNSIDVGAGNLHRDWDQVPPSLAPADLGTNAVAEAKNVAPTTGDVMTWSTQWADDAIVAAPPVFADLTYGPEDLRFHWKGSLPEGYTARREVVQRTQLLKASARLAQLLQTLWP